MKRRWFYTIGAIIMALMFALCGCGNENKGDNGGNGGGEIIDETKLAAIIPTAYDYDIVKDVTETAAGSHKKWQNQVFTPNGGNNDEGVTDSVIHSPWHTLEVNGTAVPVYTARCGKSSHSFARIDVTDHQDDFILKVKLTMDASYPVCAVLPLSRGVEATREDKVYTSLIKAYGSYTYTFSETPGAKVTDPTLAPLTIMVTREETLEDALATASGFEYDVREIEPGYHESDALEFTDAYTCYVIKAGVHEFSSINVPANSILWLERGAYLKCEDRQENGGWNTKTAIHAENCENPKILGRGLLDMGSVLGGDYKRKHVVGIVRCQSPVVKGLTIINSNTWTMCFYNDDDALMEDNLLLGYRTYSDGLMMSECRDSVGRYNFVRTGDDGIEFKGTGWNGQNPGADCLYEYNDVWTDKGCAYGLTWESDCDMDGMTFRNNTVGFAQPIWNEHNNALDCRLGTNSSKTWSNILFENIEIYHVISPVAIITQVTGKGANLENVTFRNIDVYSAELGTAAYNMTLGEWGEISGIVLENYTFCGTKITESDKNTAKMKFENRAEKSALTVR